MTPIVQQFQDNLSIVVDRYRDQGLTLSEAIGVFELIKLDLWRDQRETAEDEIL